MTRAFYSCVLATIAALACPAHATCVSAFLNDRVNSSYTTPMTTTHTDNDSLMFSVGGKLVVSHGRHIEVRDIATNRELQKILIPLEHSPRFFVSPNRDYVVVLEDSGIGNSVAVFEFHDGQLSLRYVTKQKSTPVDLGRTHMLFSISDMVNHDGIGEGKYPRFVREGADLARSEPSKLYDWSDRFVRDHINKSATIPPENKVNHVSFSQNGDHFLLNSNAHISVHNIETGEALRSWNFAHEELQQFQGSKADFVIEDGKELVSCMNKAHSHKLDVETGLAFGFHTYDDVEGFHISFLTTNNDCSYGVSGTWCEGLAISFERDYNAVYTNRPRYIKITEGDALPTRFEYSRSNRLLASYEDGSFAVYGRRTAGGRATLYSYKPDVLSTMVRGTTISADGNWVANFARINSRNSIEVHNVMTEKSFRLLVDDEGDTHNELIDLNFSEESKLLLIRILRYEVDAQGHSVNTRSIFQTLNLEAEVAPYIGSVEP